MIAGVLISFDCLAQRRDDHALVSVGLDPPNRVGADTEQVGPLLNPGVRLFGGVHAEALRMRVHEPFGAYIPACHGDPGCPHADEIGHIAAAYEEAAAI